MRILGVSAFYHDSAAALVVDGRIVAAAQEERFTRKKHDSGFPAEAVRYCLAEGGLTLGEVDHIAFYDKPFLKFERLLETYLAFAPKGFRSFRTAMPIWMKEKLFQKRLLRQELEEIEKIKGRFGKAAAVHRAPSKPRRQRLLPLAVRGGRRAHHRRGRRMGDHQPRRRQRPRSHHAEGDPLPALSRPPLFRLHLLYRLQGQFWRIQDHGPRPLWRPEICRI